MKKICFYFILFCIAITLKAQDKVNVLVPYTEFPPKIDGVIWEDWDMMPEVPIENILMVAGVEDEPTVTAYWKALWNDTALFVLVNVEDDDHWPAWEAGGSWYLYDQVEIYLDVNAELNDGIGPGTKGSGHYQVQPNFGKDLSGVPGLLSASNYRPGGEYCYVLDGENYVFEYAIKISSLTNKEGVALTIDDLRALDFIGFDVTIVDQDEGITTDRQRAVWQNVGEKNECYNNMDDAGTITLVDNLEEPEGDKLLKNNSLSVYPNPVSARLNITADFDKLIIRNLLGAEVVKIESSNKSVNVEMLPKGMYLLQVFKGGNPVGITKINKI